jgi:hypothetical protein
MAPPGQQARRADRLLAERADTPASRARAHAWRLLDGGQRAAMRCVWLDEHGVPATVLAAVRPYLPSQPIGRSADRLGAGRPEAISGPGRRPV